MVMSRAARRRVARHGVGAASLPPLCFSASPIRVQRPRSFRTIVATTQPAERREMPPNMLSVRLYTD
jgi:hypothetical protein